MSTQTPQTDEQSRTASSMATYPGRVVKESFAQSLELDRDHYKALCEELRLLQYANEAASFEQGLAERAGEIEAMREAIKRAVDDMNNWSLVQGKTLSGICADLEQALNEGKP